MGLDLDEWQFGSIKGDFEGELYEQRRRRRELRMWFVDFGSDWVWRWKSGLSATVERRAVTEKQNKLDVKAHFSIKEAEEQEEGLDAQFGLSAALTP
jgi:hypothetical protein